jgi:hypothetical protein
VTSRIFARKTAKNIAGYKINRNECAFMQFFENIRRRRRRDMAVRHRQWWETAAEFPADDPPGVDFDPAIADFPASEFDPMGGYTGNPIDGEAPVQDADDL